jgi:hypothetical protein
MSQVGTETSIFVDKYDVTLDVCISSVFLQTKIPNHSCVYPISMHPFVPNFATNLIFCLIYQSIEVMKKTVMCRQNSMLLKHGCMYAFEDETLKRKDVQSARYAHPIGVQ